MQGELGVWGRGDRKPSLSFWPQGRQLAFLRLPGCRVSVTVSEGTTLQEADRLLNVTPQAEKGVLCIQRHIPAHRRCVRGLKCQVQEENSHCGSFREKRCVLTLKDSPCEQQQQQQNNDNNRTTITTSAYQHPPLRNPSHAHIIAVG